MDDNRCQPGRCYPPIDVLMNLSSLGDADQATELTESMYCGLGFLVDLIGLDRFGIFRILGQSALLNISLVTRGPFSKYPG